MFAIFTKHYACVCCAIIDIATCQVLLMFKIKVQVDKCGNMWNFVDSPTISDALLHLFYCIFLYLNGCLKMLKIQFITGNMQQMFVNK